MRKVLILIISLCHVSFINGQTNLQNYVRQTTVSIDTVDPDSIDFKDLIAIGEAIGSSKIVMLGEQDHGDAPTFLAKTRLIKYLHEKMGFNVLAFESDFFGLNFGFDRLEKSKSQIDSFIRRNIFPIWTYCDACQNLFYNYIPSTYESERPLMITGFDNQFVLDFSFKNFTYYLDSVLQSLRIEITTRKNYETDILIIIDSLKYHSFRDTINYSKCNSYLTEIKSQVMNKLDENGIWMQMINNLLSENKQFQLLKSNRIEGGNIRDARMAANLSWLSNEKFPNEKIIVWAANAHVAKYADSSSKNARRLIAMGSYFTENVKTLASTYVIGFTSYEGNAGRLGFKTYAVRKPMANSFENWIDKSYKYAFSDFKTYNLQYPKQSNNFFLKGLGHTSAFKKDWTKVFDGIFFTGICIHAGGRKSAANIVFAQ